MAFQQSVKCVATGAAMAAMSSPFLFGTVQAKSPFSFGGGGNEVPPPIQAPPPPAPPKEQPSSNPNPRTTAAGFDPEALERGAKALREIQASAYASKTFELMKKQEETRLGEEKAKAASFAAQQAQLDIERQRVLHDEQRKTIEKGAQTKAQLARYEDELARQRMLTEHEHNRARNQELVRMQEESASRQEAVRARTEEQIQAQRRLTEERKAELDRETLRVKALAEAEGRAHEAKLSEEVNRRMLLERAKAEQEKWMAAISLTFSQVGGGLRSLLTERDKMAMAVGGATALAAGVYGTREGARVLWGYIDRVLGQPSLLRESSRGKYPWSRLISSATSALSASSATAAEKAKMASGQGFGDVILHSSLHSRIRQLAASVANTKKHNAPFRNMLFYGPPGTGKTMAAKELARQSGLEYALMTGGDVAPLGAQAVTKIHEVFDWASRSRKGLLLFIDEADAFLCERNNQSMSEAQRSALNAMLYRTGDQSRDIVMVLATNRPGDLDAAVTDRVDEVLEFPLPGESERFKLLALYLDKYVAQSGGSRGGVGAVFQGLVRKAQARIEIRGVTESVLKEAAVKTEGFSGRELAKLMASIRGAVYGSAEGVLDASLFREVVDYKVAEHQQRKLLKDTAKTIDDVELVA